MAETVTTPEAPATTAVADATAPTGSRTLGGILLFLALVVVIYWVLWFLIPGGRDLLAVLPKDQRYITFENAFPAADGWLAICAAVGGALLVRRNAVAIPWLFMAASAGMYLAGMDILYDLENGVYLMLGQNPGSVATEMIINLVTVIFSVYGLIFAARHHRWWRAQ
jgi:hypothetical protein